jgi:hypothetical protein
MTDGYRTVEVPDDGNFWLVLPNGSILQRPHRTVVVCGSCGVGYYEEELIVTDEGGEVVEWAFPCGHVRGEAEVDG